MARTMLQHGRGAPCLVYRVPLEVGYGKISVCSTMGSNGQAIHCRGPMILIFFWPYTSLPIVVLPGECPCQQAAEVHFYQGLECFRPFARSSLIIT